VTLIDVDKTVGYYGKNIVKPHIWREYIPLYFFAGGLAGGSAALALASRLRGNARAARAGFVVAAVSAGISGVLLIADLGRPLRFLNMLRMVKVTSPMNVGTWIFSAFSGGAMVAAFCDLFGKRDTLIARVAEFTCGVLGIPLAAYTAVLIGDTATPVWFEARFELPFVFVSSAAGSAGALSALLVPGAGGRAARRLAVMGAAAEVYAHHAMVKRLGVLGEPYRRGPSGALASASRVCSSVGAALMLVAGKRRFGRVAGGLLILAGALTERLAVLEAGRLSALDPKYVLEQQRLRPEPFS
jgi:Polysulphide reductase, NrfD